MGGTLSHRSFSHFIQPCISTFSTFQIYLFHIFYDCFFEGPGEKLFGMDLYIHINKPPCGRLYGPEGTGRGLWPRHFSQLHTNIKWPLDKIFYKNIIWIHAYQLFQLFKFICSIYFMVVFLRDLERNFLEGFSQWPFYSTTAY